MKGKKAICAVLSGVLALALSACSGIDLSVDNLLTPPKQEGDIYPIQQALEAYAGGAVTLKYPMSGEYRSAFILHDTDGNGLNEAFAFYSDTTDGNTTMHLNFIVSDDQKWVCKSDVGIVGNGVEKLTFADLDSDGRQEIIVGWMGYGAADKRVAVYSLEDDRLTPYALERYTDFLCTDLSGQGHDELVVLCLSSNDQPAVAKVFSVDRNGVMETGSAPLDSGASAYSAPMLSRLSDGRTAVFVDAVKGSGLLTEIIWFDKGTLKSICDPDTKETSATFRSSPVASRDFNGDGCVEIPLLSLLQSTAERDEIDRVYVTDWNTFDGGGLHRILSAFMNYSDGYYLQIPDDWRDTITLERKTDARLRVFSRYDPKSGAKGSEMFRIMTVTEQDLGDGNYMSDGYFLLKQSGGLAYLARIEENSPVDQPTLKQNFNLID